MLKIWRNRLVVRIVSAIVATALGVAVLQAVAQEAPDTNEEDSSATVIGTIERIPDLISDLGSLEGILRLLGLSKWEEALNDLLNDPCADAPVIFITTPEPGWCQGSGSDIGSILRGTAGDMGIPDPNTARQRAEEEAKSRDTVPDIFDINRVVYSKQVGNLTDRIVTKQAIEALLGRQGQEKMAEKLETTQDIVTTNAENAATAQEYDVTQDIMKVFVGNMARETAIAADTQTELTNLRVDTQFTNLNLTNISRTLDEEARHKRVEQSAASAKILTLSAQAGLIGQR